MTTFLRFPDEARARACMSDWYAEGWQAPEGCAIDIVGPIDGAGFHINVIGEVPRKAEAFVVSPLVPVRVFAAMLVVLMLVGCSNTFQTKGDAVGYCMVLGEVPALVDGRVTCSGE